MPSFRARHFQTWALGSDDGRGHKPHTRIRFWLHPSGSVAFICLDGFNMAKALFVETDYLVRASQRNDLTGSGHQAGNTAHTKKECGTLWLACGSGPDLHTRNGVFICMLTLVRSPTIQLNSLRKKEGFEERLRVLTEAKIDCEAKEQTSIERRNSLRGVRESEYLEA